MIKVSKNLSLPEDAITQTFGFIGRKGSGKTYAASRLCELFLQRNIQCIVLDPVGNWYGLRLDAGGKKPSSYDIPIIGGEHGDIPLDHKSGETVANFLLESGSSSVLDVSHFRKGQRKEFVAMFAEQLFHGQKKRRIPLHLFVEEAQVFIPQRAGRGEERMLGAMEDIVRLGRNYGIGVSLNSQRPQSVNKEVLNQVEPLIVFQVVGAHERKAIQEWVTYSGADIKEQLNTLASLQNGDGFLWSPAWLNTFKKIRFTKKDTFDASATPTLSDKTFQTGKLSDISLSDLDDQMKAMVEKASENDPKKLQQQIKKLARELTVAKKGVPEHEVNSRIREAVNADRDNRKEVPAIDPGLMRSIQQIHDITTKALTGETAQTITTSKKPASNRSIQIATEPPPTGGPEQRILNALVWWESTGIPSPYSRIQVSFIAGYKPKSGGFNNPLGALRTAGLVEYPVGGYVCLTDQGREKADPVEAQATQEQLHIKIMRKLGGPQQRILKPVLDCYPENISREELAAASGYNTGSGGFNNPLGSLRSLGLITYPMSGYVLASPELFIE